MANLRNLKKDIDYLSMEVISDCWAFMYLFPDKKQEECNKIINDTIDLRNEMFHQVNHPVKDESNKCRPYRKYYTGLNKTLFEKIDALFVRISELNK